MKLLVLPPHRDVTLVPEAPEGWRCVDVAREFCRRVFARDAVEAAAVARERAPATAQTMRELLLVRAAQSLHAREDASVSTHLRALGAVLSAISGPPDGVHLRLDDVELAGGTTERSADVLRSLDQPASYLDDLSRAAERFAGAERVRLWLERDLQLPAAAWLARACPEDVPLEVAGPFARAHRAVLARLSVFQRATFVDAVPLRWRVSPSLDETSPTSRVWLSEALEVRATTLDTLRALTGGEVGWAGHMSLDSLLHPDVLVASGCKVAAVGFCAADNDAWVDPLGARVSRAALARGARRLRDAGVHLVAEWWVGAPGVDEADLDATLAVLDAEPVFDKLAGVRPFHWPRTPPESGRPLLWPDVKVGAPPDDRDLARSRPFEHARSIPSARVPQVLEGLATRLLARGPLNPGRVAAACLPEVPRPRATDASAAAIRLDADCAWVQLPAGLDGAPKPSWFAANLRTGSVLAMDARLAPKLAGLVRPMEVASVLGAVPQAQREKLVDTLVARSVLTRVNG
ncbi:hypothetical protein HV824_28830 [Myxococcus sp. AM009]|uniref:hypothetical protein n=1 Tax=unclassified Myxococcus TaxID=2648731 RepID=UPI00159532E8|nr:MULTISPECIES: hypothetical protein [unclassified Myxococcus]NVJ02101.1 hypothetical protein [Myxococcus sp. AM009]NVJ14388.1 hypothetical protein [Myxococcus sp. AM010]